LRPCGDPRFAAAAWSLPIVADREPANVALGRAVSRLRREQGMTQRQLAEASGIHRNYLSGIECGRQGPSWRVIVALARALTVSPGVLAALAERERSNEQGAS
jgi:transcriptional regulator with XRE-family HTH domain